MKATIARSNLVHPLARALATAALLSLGACASFDGQPRAVIQPVLALPAGYEPAAALADYYNLDSEGERKNYRNRVIGIYMTAADANFIEYRRNLSREMKGANFGIGTAIVGLTSVGSFAAERTANILSAGAAGLAGTQGKLSREVYFEKTLPALFAGMEANRTQVRTTIVGRMADGDKYSLGEALSDLARYEAAASLDQAIETMTTETAKRAEREQERFANVIGLGSLVEDPVARIELRELSTSIDALVPTRETDLDKILDHLNLPTSGSAEDKATRIITRLGAMAQADPSSLGKFVEEMKTAGVDLTPTGGQQ